MEEKIIMRSDNPECDWTEDFEHENGNYQNHCHKCKALFFGHKRRIVCKKCASHQFLPKPAAFYGCIYNIVQEVGIANGYAVAIHGSLARDLDLIAVPWTNDAISDFELIKLIAEVLGGECRNENGFKIGLGNDAMYGKDYTPRPHERRAYRIYLGNSFEKQDGGLITYYIDISVTPRFI